MADAEAVEAETAEAEAPERVATLTEPKSA